VKNQNCFHEEIKNGLISLPFGLESFVFLSSDVANIKIYRIIILHYSVVWT
jgi:hypothetical protein